MPVYYYYREERLSIVDNAMKTNWAGFGSVVLIGVVFSLLSSAEVMAQIEVDLKMDRTLYVTHEPVTGTLTIINRAGRDLVFGDHQGMSWLDFTVTNGMGHLITPVQHVRNAKPIVLAAGQTYEHEVTINRYYPMSTIGVYRVNAVVTFPQIGRVFKTKISSVQITDGQAMWSQIVGVPQGHPKAGSYREYSLMTYYHGARNKSLYFRLRDSDSGMVFKTYPLGDYMTVRAPMHAIDRLNRLHVLHMSSPQKYSYTIIDIDGDPISQRRFAEKGSDRPKLVTNDFGEVSVVGGLTEEEAAATYEHRQFRLLSERPPGMPRVD